MKRALTNPLPAVLGRGLHHKLFNTTYISAELPGFQSNRCTITG